jgi:Zn-dependent protease with chaperone function
MFMLSNVPGSALAAVCIALAPACVVWWLNRALARSADDSLLAERLLATRMRGRYVLALAWGIVIVEWPDHCLWLIALMLVMRALAAYPLRKALHGETWTRAGYLWFFSRLIAAVLGFWLLLTLLPELSRWAGRGDWIVSILVAGVLLLWNERYADTLRLILRTTPITDAEVTARFAELARQVNVPVPRFEAIPVNGGVLANAVAVPSLRGSNVLMTSTLLERFARDEIVAICAHELAHIEYYNLSRLRGLRLGTIALVAAGALAAPVVRISAPTALPWVTVPWIGVILVYHAIRARSRQKNETASDVRAVELTGNPEALVSALVKLHTLGLVPRRWEARVERSASHPSLARRIQAIRGAAGCAPPVLEGASVFVSGETSITLDPDRLQWSEGELATHMVSYAQLTELRIDAGKARALRLVAVARSGQRWTFALDAVDVSRAQAALDVVDAQLAALSGPPVLDTVPPRALSILAAIVAGIAGQLAVLLPVAFAAARPSAALMAAAAAASISSAAVAWRDSASHLSRGAPFVPAMLLGVSGIVLLVMAWRRRTDDVRQTSPWFFAVLALGSVAAWAGVLLSGTDVVHLHQGVHAWPSAVVLPAALAAGLAWTGGRSLRRASASIVLATGFVFVIGSKTYLESFSTDLFLGRAGPLAVRELAGDALSEAVLPFEPAELRLSPNARRVAFARDDDDDDLGPFYIGPPSGPFEPVGCDSCDNAFFVDDERLLLVERQRAAVVLREVEADGNHAVLWERRVADVRSPRVAFRQETGVWSVLGTGQEAEVVRVEGKVGDGAFAERRWSARSITPAQGGWAGPIAASPTHVLMQRRRYRAAALTRQLRAFAWLVAPDWRESDFWIVDASGIRAVGTSRFEVDCDSMIGGDGQPLCISFDGTGTTVYSLDLLSGQLEARASLQGRLSHMYDQGAGWLVGAWDRTLVALSDNSREAWRAPAPDTDWVRAMAASRGAVATGTRAGSRWLVRVYQAPQVADRSGALH